MMVCNCDIMGCYCVNSQGLRLWQVCVCVFMEYKRWYKGEVFVICTISLCVEGGRRGGGPERHYTGGRESSISRNCTGVTARLSEKGSEGSIKISFESKVLKGSLVDVNDGTELDRRLVIVSR